jgi:hypothetical protein
MLNSSIPLTASSLNSILAEYESIDDVWSQEFLTSIFIQYDGPETGDAVDASISEFLSTNGVQYAFLATAFEQPAFSIAAQYSTVSGCDLTSGPYVASFSNCGNGFGLTPAYTLHVDYETYGAQNYTTETVELCFKAGASLIEKTRTIAVALGAANNG